MLTRSAWPRSSVQKWWTESGEEAELRWRVLRKARDGLLGLGPREEVLAILVSCLHRD